MKKNLKKLFLACRSQVKLNYHDVKEIYRFSPLKATAVANFSWKMLNKLALMKFILTLEKSCGIIVFEFCNKPFSH